MRLPFLLLLSFFAGTALAQRTEPFCASKPKDKLIGTPYDYTQSYFEFIDAKNPFVREVNDSDNYVIYFFLDVSLSELGIRVLSPIPPLTTPNKGNIATDEYSMHSNELNKGFDAYIALFRATGTHNRNDLNLADENYSWSSIAFNDNNYENRDYKNPLLRLENASIPAGLYMLSIGSRELKKLRGSFLLQIGANPGVRINNLQKSPYLLK
jgi:hypothetical protein